MDVRDNMKERCHRHRAKPVTVQTKSELEFFKKNLIIDIEFRELFDGDEKNSSGWWVAGEFTISYKIDEINAVL